MVTQVCGEWFLQNGFEPIVNYQESDLAAEEFDQCVRLHTEAHIYNSSFAGRFCDRSSSLVSGLMEEAVEAAEATEATAEAEDAFGNCTIPQVSMVLSVVEFQVWWYKVDRF